MSKANGNAMPSLKHYDQERLRQIGLPLGGIGTGVVSLGGRGNLHDWEIVNRPAKGFDLQQSFFCLYTRDAEGRSTAYALEGVIPPADYEGARGAVVPNHGLPRFRGCSFESAYPFGRVNLSDESVPLGARLDAFNPLIPTDADASGIPVAVLRFTLTNASDSAIDAAVCGSLQNFIGSDGSNGAPKDNVNTLRQRDGMSGIFMSSQGVDPDAAQWGTLALTTPTRDGITARTAWANLSWGDSLLDFWDDFSADGKLEERARDGLDNPTGSLCVSLTVPANGSAEVVFFLSWHFPNRITWQESGTQSPAEHAASWHAHRQLLHDAARRRLGGGSLYSGEPGLARSREPALREWRLRQRPAGCGQGSGALQPQHLALADGLPHARRLHVRLGGLR